MRSCSVALCCVCFACAAPLFTVHTTDAKTGRGIPRVSLTMIDSTEYVTDSAGFAAIDITGLEGLHVFMRVSTDGYAMPTDPFGFRGFHAQLKAGGRANVTLARTQVAERLYRLTGFGTYLDSVKLGLHVPISKPLMNAGVVGQDSVLAVEFAGSLHWFWGDTNRESYPLGNFFSTGATSCLPTPGSTRSTTSESRSSGCLSPEDGVDLTYFAGSSGATAGDQFVLPMAKIEPISLPTWIGGAAVVRDDSNSSSSKDGVTMTASFVKPGKV